MKKECDRLGENAAVYSADSDRLSRPFRPTFTEGETSSRGELITPPEAAILFRV